MLSAIKECAWVFILGTIAAVLWYTFYVSPNDSRMNDIMECMGDDRSRESYDACSNLVGEK